MTGIGLGGLTLTPGVYAFDTSAQLTGPLTLDGLGNPNAMFIFNIGSTLTTASGSSVGLVNGAQGRNVFYRVGSSATLGTTTSFAGNILALTSITANTGATINCGAALARNGAVTLDTNTISICTAAATTLTPTPSDPSITPGITPVIAPIVTTVLVAPIETALPSSATYNQRAVANALDAFVSRGGTLPLPFQSLVSFLSPVQMGAAFTRLAGEAATGVAPTAIRAMNSFLSLTLNGLGEDRVDATAPAPESPLDAPVSAYASFNSVPVFYKADRAVTPDPRRWSVWAASYGGQGTTSGTFSAGTHDRSAQTFGVASGLDYRVSPDTRIGFSLAGGATNFGLADGLGGGRSDMFQAALSGRTDFNDAYASAVLAYGWHDVSTARDVGNDRLKAEFSGHNIAGRSEIGYRFALPSVLGLPGTGWITPYAAGQVQAFYLPAYTEGGAPSSSVFALEYGARTTTTTRTELGTRINRAIPMDHGASLELRARAGWVHDTWSHPSVLAMFRSLPGPSFVAIGAKPVPDSLLIATGAELRMANGFSVAASFETELAERSHNYIGKAGLRYTW
jgi:outer membrane autotransporter protein